MKKIAIVLLAIVMVLVAVISALAQEKCEAPVLNVGDKWTYRDIAGQTYPREAIRVENDIYVVRTGNSSIAQGYDNLHNFLLIVNKTGASY